MLSRLAVHYYRPDFSEAQAKSLIADMLQDLEGFGVHEIEQAILDYRRDPKMKFFPRAADLRERAGAARRDMRPDRFGAGGIEFGESRPNGWEFLPKALWQSNWRADDLLKAADPLRHERYLQWFDRVQAGKIANKTPGDY